MYESKTLEFDEVFIYTIELILRRRQIKVKVIFLVFIKGFDKYMGSGVVSKELRVLGWLNYNLLVVYVYLRQGFAFNMYTQSNKIKH